MSKRPKGVILDNDDTAQARDPRLGYGSPEDQYYAAFEAVALTFGKHVPKDSELRQKVMGIDIREVGRFMINELALPITFEQWKSALDQILLALAPFAGVAPGFEEAVAAMRNRGLIVGIASSSVRSILNAKWRRFPELRATFGCFVAGDDLRIGKGKPAPDLLYVAAEDLGLDPDECAYIGDSRSDMIAAQRAGMRGILFKHPGREFGDLPHTTEIVHSFAEMLEIL